MDVQVPVKSGKTVHVNKNYAIELKSQKRSCLHSSEKR